MKNIQDAVYGHTYIAYEGLTSPDLKPMAKPLEGSIDANTTQDLEKIQSVFSTKLRDSERYITL